MTFHLPMYIAIPFIGFLVLDIVRDTIFLWKIIVGFNTKKENV